MDLDGLERLLGGHRGRRHRRGRRDLTEPSPLALEVLSARPYAYLDDAPLEERRTQAVMSRRWLSPEEASDLGRLDPEAIARVRAEAWPDPPNADELHDALVWLGFLTAEKRAPGRAGATGSRSCAPEPRGAARCGRGALWIAAERLPQFQALWPAAKPRARDRGAGRRRAGARLVARGGAGRDRARPPRRAGAGHAERACRAARAGAGRRPRPRSAALQTEGFAMRGRFTPDAGVENGASAGCSPASTATPSSGCGPRSSRSPRATSCASC